MNQKGFSKPITEGAEASQAAILPVSLPQPRCNQSLASPNQGRPRNNGCCERKRMVGCMLSGFF